MDTIKQLIPISDDVSAMISLGDKNQEVLQDAREIGFQVFLALVEDEDRDSTVIPYVIDPYGFGGLDWVVDFVPVRRCPKCGEKMLVRMKDEASDPEYYCRCE